MRKQKRKKKGKKEKKKRKKKKGKKKKEKKKKEKKKKKKKGKKGKKKGDMLQQEGISWLFSGKAIIYGESGWVFLLKKTCRKRVDLRSFILGIK